MGYDNPNKKPTIEQLNYLKILGYTGKIPETRYQTSLLIADLIYHWRPKEPTQPQKNKLKELGYKGPTPKTRGDTADLIRELVKQRGDKLTAADIQFIIYATGWSEKNPFEHILEHKPEFYDAQNWRDSFGN